LERDISEIKFPLVVLTASWWHNDIYLIEKISDNYKLEIKKLGQTLDDAAGECFDKVARMLGGPYPWWVRISEKALQWKPNDLVKFKRIFLAKQEYNFSFSGMKSQVWFLIEEFNKKEIKIDEQLICDIAYEFQEAMVEALAKKLLQAGLEYNAQTIGISWWVSANDRLREYLNELKDKKLKNAQILRPNKKIYSTDNAAMIGVEGVLKYINQ
jgi:N6-L-threonylcarbamoyladenine synthase